MKILFTLVITFISLAGICQDDHRSISRSYQIGNGRVKVVPEDNGGLFFFEKNGNHITVSFLDTKLEKRKDLDIPIPKEYKLKKHYLSDVFSNQEYVFFLLERKNNIALCKINKKNYSFSFINHNEIIALKAGIKPSIRSSFFENQIIYWSSTNGVTIYYSYDILNNKQKTLFGGNKFNSSYIREVDNALIIEHSPPNQINTLNLAILKNGIRNNICLKNDDIEKFYFPSRCYNDGKQVVLSGFCNSLNEKKSCYVHISSRDKTQVLDYEIPKKTSINFYNTTLIDKSGENIYLFLNYYTTDVISGTSGYTYSTDAVISGTSGYKYSTPTHLAPIKISLQNGNIETYEKVNVSFVHQKNGTMHYGQFSNLALIVKDFDKYIRNIERNLDYNTNNVSVNEVSSSRYLSVPFFKKWYKNFYLKASYSFKGNIATLLLRKERQTTE